MTSQDKFFPNDIVQLSRSRAAFKGKLTQFTNFIDNLATPLTADDILNLEFRIENVTSTYEKFDTIQMQLECLSEDTSSQLLEREKFEELYFESLAKAKGLVMAFRNDNDEPEAKPSHSSECIDSIKFPEIALPSFSGDFREWLEFRETFDALINQSSLKSIQKFKYLRSCLKDGALEVVNSIEYTSDGYQMAWRLLCERYNNPRLLVSNHLRSLFEIPSISSENAKSLRALIDNINKHLRSLHTLNIPIDDWDLIIIYFMSNKLPSSLQRSWEENQSSNVLPSLQDFKNFIRRRADILDNLNVTKPGGPEARKSLVTTSSKPIVNPSCPQCKGRHYLNQCNNFLALNARERYRAVKSFHLCTNCLGNNHNVSNCRSSHCKYCKGKHNTLLHIDSVTPSTMHVAQPISSTSLHSHQTNKSNNQVPVREHVQPAANAGSINTHTHNNAVTAPTKNQKIVFLSTAMVRAYDSRHQTHNLRVLLDSGSQSNFISEKAFQLLKLAKRNVNMEVIGFNDTSTKIKEYCNLNIESNDRQFQTKLTCLIVPQICNLPNYNSPKITQLLNIPAHIKLADENFSSAGEVDLLIGAELFYNLLCFGRHSLGEGCPILQKTKLGWIVSGSLASPMQVRCNLSLKTQLKHFWEMEECGDNPFTPHNDQVSYDDKVCEKVFMTHTRNAEGNFVIQLPFKFPISNLGQSKHIAQQRFHSLERKFSKNDEFKQMYIQFMREFEQTGRMEKCTSSDVPLNFLPHHAVVNLEKSTTPLRVVFDASCPTSSGYSLNDILHKGTIKQDTLNHILLRFRLHKYVINADIRKMFCCIHINADQQPLQCILWREEPHHELQTFKLTTLSFGLKPAPHIATRCLLHLAQETRTALQQLPDAARSSAELPVAVAAAAAIEEQFYADDLLLSGDDEHRITQVALEVDRVLRTANFHLRKWKTNSSQIQQALPTQTESTTSQSVQLGQPGDSLHKILGLQWSNQNDNLNYSINLQPIPNNVTKRVILSRVSSIFDPLGLLGPCLILAKCFIQRLWVDGSDWDQPISQTLLKDWLTFYNGLQYLRLLQIPRVVTISNYITFQLHGFADSSTQAYGAAIYVLTTNAQGQTLVRLLFSKTRVAPLKTQTIPRLELSAALLLAVNMKDLQSSLKVPINDIQYWSDSTITLAWIKTEPHKLNTFVANRVTKIQALTDKSKWRWVPSNENPADLLSRGVLPDKLVNCTTTSKFWFEGPTFLSKPQGEWPQNKQQTQELIELKAKHSPCKTLCNTTQNRANDNTFINNLISRWSSDTKLFRIFALVLRFFHNCKNKTHKITGPISCQEQRQAANKLIIFTQIESFPNEYKLLKNNSQLPKTSKLLSLKPFMDNDLIRVGGRLSQSHYEFDKKHPIILHSNHTLTKLIMRNEHVRLMHAGPQLLLSSMKEQYWPIKGKLLANNIFRECVPCFRAKPHTPTPIMGDLPGHRVQPAPPFYTVALDYAGPFLLKDRQGRGCKTYKSYIAIFICSSTKAVHIELVTGLETHSFLSAFRRFIARRGKPRVVVSDNGTTFRGADRELRELYDFLNTNSNELTTSCTEQGIEWKFVPSYSPHMNGLAEGAVKSCKYHLKRVLKQSLLTYEGFSTILIQIEGILNSRPLCPIPFSDSEIFQVLTPAHFLIGRTPVALPDYQYDEVPTNRLKYFQQLQQIYQSFWKGFSRDYVGLLQQRGKWQSSKGPTLAAGSVVLIKDKHTPPCQWRLARIIETHPGGDGVTRVATLRTSQGSNIKLSFPRICPLPILDNN